ncbi:MAG: hypothetical protein JWL99_900, partial [Streptomyces oryziradicis]|nr:hypothetical protein [Actinacidiphila oryziradicis]
LIARRRNALRLVSCARSGDPGSAPGREPESRPTAGPALADSVPYGLFGLGSGALILRSSADAHAVAALALSMGAAEWLLYRYRGLGLAALRRSPTAAGFRVRAGGALALCLTGYLAVLAALAAVAGALWPGGPPHGVPRSLVAAVALGAVLWVALLLQAFGSPWPPAAVCLGAALAETARAAPTADPAVLRSAVSVVSAVLLLTLAYFLLGRATAHR